MPPKKGSRPKRSSKSPNSDLQKRKRTAASLHKPKPKRRRKEGSSTNATSLPGSAGSNTETVLQTLVKSMSEMQKQIKCLQEGRQLLSNLAGARGLRMFLPLIFHKTMLNHSKTFLDQAKIQIIHTLELSHLTKKQSCWTFCLQLPRGPLTF